MLRLPNPPVFAYYSNLAIKPSSSAGKASSKDVLFKVAATEDTVIAAMVFSLAARDASTSTFPAN